MLKKKICLLGSFAVGKTSLVQRFIHSKFSEKYLTTIGVKIDQKTVVINDMEVDLLIWDIHGEDEFQKIPLAYLKGSAGFILVLDGTRRSSILVAEKVRNLAAEAAPEAPFVLLMNKCDLKDQWEITMDDLGETGKSAIAIMETSAKTGEGVDEAFIQLTKRII